MAGHHHAGRGARTASGILSYFARHATVANLLLLVMLAAGLAALPLMRAQYFPDVVINQVMVSVDWSGAGADDVDRAILQVLEPELLTVEGVETISSRASEGRARITLEFEPGWDMGRARDDVETAVATADDLPEDADAPDIRRVAWRDRVTDVVVAGPVSPEQLGRFADELVTRLYGAGITRTTIQGRADPETVVEVPTAELVKHGIGMADIAAAITAEVAADPAGDISGGSARVRTGIEKRDPRAIAAIVLRSNPDGSTLTIGDVATVQNEGATGTRAMFVGDDPAMSIRVDRSDLGDAIEIHQKVTDVVEEMGRVLPPDVRMDLVRARAEDISARLSLLIDNGIMGLGLVLVLLFLFLNARTAIWVATGIPVSLLAALAAMYVGGYTLNMISLFALIITLGIVVDDAIVVGEHADFRARHLGESPAAAAENAARWMAAPVLASSLTTMIAFLGLLAIGGRFGTLISAIPITVTLVLAASLIECFLILPAHMRHALVHVHESPWYDAPNRWVNRGFEWVKLRVMRPVVRLVIRARYPVIAAALALLAYQASLFITGQVGWRFFNAPEEGAISGNFSMLAGASRDDTREMMRELQAATEALGVRYAEEYGINPLKHVLAEIGGNGGRMLASSETKDASLLGAITIELIDPDLRPYTSFRFVSDLQDAAPRHPKLEELSFRGMRSGPGGDALDVELSGADAGALKAASLSLQAAVARFPEVSGVEDNMSYDKRELILELTPQGQALGFTTDTLGRLLRNRLNGIEAASFPDGPRSATIRVELPEHELSADFLDTTLLPAASGTYLPLSDLVTVASHSGFSTIRRENGLRVVAITGDIDESDPARATAIQSELQDSILPAIAAQFGVTWKISGLAEQEDDFLKDALTGLLLCLLGIYIVLAWIFSSWTRPIVVMTIIPFGLVGAVWGHYVWGLPLSMFSVVGLIGMSGIIINDSIVLISTIDEYAAGRGMVPAIVDSVADRLRPVLLTTLTTVLGLAPLLYEDSSQAAFLKPTVITLAYGLGFGMALVLLVVPAVVAVQEDITLQIRALRRALRPANRNGRAARVHYVVSVAALAVVAIFAATLGSVLATGRFAAGFGGVAEPMAALAVFVAGSAGVSLLAAILGALMIHRKTT